MLKATKIRIYPKKEQETKLDQQFGCVRFVYNEALAFKTSAYKDRQEKVSCFDLIKRLPALKAEHSWLNDTYSQSLQSSLRNLDDAFQKFFKKTTKYPKFKKKFGSKKTLTFPQGVKVKDDNQIYLPKTGWVKARIHRELIGTMKNVTVSKTPTGKYFASICMETGVEKPKPLTHVDDVLGIDLGLKELAIFDDGTKIENPRFLKKAQRNLLRKSRNFSRTRKGSNRRNKARVHLAKAHEKVANARADFLHKLSFKLADENQAVGLESLKVKNMIKNHKLAKAIADVSWGELIRQIGYKMLWQGKIMVQIDTFFPSSKTCSACNFVLDKLPLSIRNWYCPNCNTFHDRDVNAANNIRNRAILDLKAAGCSVSASGGLCKSFFLKKAVALEAGSSVL